MQRRSCASSASRRGGRSCAICASGSPRQPIHAASARPSPASSPGCGATGSATTGSSSFEDDPLIVLVLASAIGAGLRLASPPCGRDLELAHEVDAAVGGDFAADREHGAARAVGEVEEAHEALAVDEHVEAVVARRRDAEIVAGDVVEMLRPGLGPRLQLLGRRAPDRDVDLAELLQRFLGAVMDDAAGAGELRDPGVGRRRRARGRRRPW